MEGENNEVVQPAEMLGNCVLNTQDWSLIDDQIQADLEKHRLKAEAEAKKKRKVDDAEPSNNRDGSDASTYKELQAARLEVQRLKAEGKAIAERVENEEAALVSFVNARFGLIKAEIEKKFA